jgi:glycerol-1-phosphate dehydrogenase [NAD(P)+]
MFEALLAGRKNCSCGADHLCAIDKILEGPGTIAQAGELLAPYNLPLLVCDKNTRRYADIAAGLIKNAELFMYDESEPLPDERNTDRLEAALGRADIIVGVGSGVINDICKLVSHKKGLPYCIIATAPSMDGYASTAAAMITGGLKITYFTHVPRYIIADTDILKKAPLEMIRAGFGDMLGKFSALNDWKLSHIVTGESFCPFIYSLMEDALSCVVSLADRLTARDDDSIRALIQGLIISGIAMAFADNSRPASGSEHHIAHFFEVVGLINSKGSLLHGTDVAFGTYITALLREKVVLGRPSQKKKPMDLALWEQNIHRVYGPGADGVIELQRAAGWHQKDLTGVIGRRWEEILALLKAHPSSAQIARLLKLAGLKFEDYIEFYGVDLINDAIFYAKDLKDRYTFLRLTDDMNIAGELTIEALMR